jgi:rhodanese-related sulfurtransferase
MKRLVALLIAGSLVAPPALAYDEALAKTYERFFASFEEKQVPKAMHLIPPEKLITAIKNGEDLVLLDVRTRQEQSVVGVTYPGTLHMPMNEVFKPENLAQIPTDKKVVVTCQAGVRCTVIATALRNIGYGSSSRRVTQPSASIELFRDLGFHADGYIATCNKFSISSCSGVGVLFW